MTRGVAAGLVLVLLAYTEANPGVLRDYCEDDGFHAQCPPGEVVLMQQARYGRMELGTCLLRDYGAMGCSIDVLTTLDRWCSGLHSCDINVRELLEAAKPCPRDLRSYLQAQYTCIPVATPKDDCCRAGNDRVRVATGSGNIASSVTEETGCGNIDCPWLLEAPNGQRFNISVFDFALPSRGKDTSIVSGDRNHASVCFVYAIIKEEGVGSTMTLCAGDVRRKHVYTTSTNSVEIRIVTKKREDEATSHFVISYVAFGCPDPIPPAHGFMERTGARATVGCPAPDDIAWEITCREGKWHGYYGNCSAAVSRRPQVGGLLSNIMHLSPDVSIVIISIVALFIAIGILITGVVCLKRRWGQRIFKRRKDSISRNGTYSDDRRNKHSTFVDAPMSRDHNYFRTWELPRQLPRQPGMNHEMFNGQADVDHEYETGYYTDHIYESPTFERRDLVRDESAKYYELDPEAEPFNPRTYQKGGSLTNGPPRLPPAKPERCSYPSTNAKSLNVMSTGAYTS